ncbi:hypothetical protein ACFLYO_10560 [Chloroflexota bacterium]
MSYGQVADQMREGDEDGLRAVLSALSNRIRETTLPVNPLPKRIYSLLIEDTYDEDGQKRLIMRDELQTAIDSLLELRWVLTRLNVYRGIGRHRDCERETSWLDLPE